MFGKKNILKEYIGEIVLIETNIDGFPYAGRVNGCDENFIRLNPYEIFRRASERDDSFNAIKLLEEKGHKKEIVINKNIISTIEKLIQE